MRVLVRFRAGGAEYALELSGVVRVEQAPELSPLPGALAPVAGLLPGEDPVPVLETLGPGRGRVLLLEHGGARFGLAVEEVLEVMRLRDDDVRPPPPGQEELLFCGMVNLGEGGHALLVDPAVLAGDLGRRVG